MGPRCMAVAFGGGLSKPASSDDGDAQSHPQVNSMNRGSACTSALTRKGTGRCGRPWQHQQE